MWKLLQGQKGSFVPLLLQFCHLKELEITKYRMEMEVEASMSTDAQLLVKTFPWVEVVTSNFRILDSQVIVNTPQL